MNRNTKKYIKIDNNKIVNNNNFSEYKTTATKFIKKSKLKSGKFYLKKYNTDLYFVIDITKFICKLVDKKELKNNKFISLWHI